MCNELGGKPAAALTDPARRNLRSVRDGNWVVDEVAPETCDPDLAAVFGFCRFPFLRTPKLEMLRIVNERGWQEVMAKTWFCHAPRKNRMPCGTCAPCTQTIRDGMGYRVPLRNRLRLYATPRGMRILLKDRPRLYSVARAFYRLRRRPSAVPDAAAFHPHATP
jgi:hypothetical protein